jgi:hypothetical protein
MHATMPMQMSYELSCHPRLDSYNMCRDFLLVLVSLLPRPLFIDTLKIELKSSLRRCVVTPTYALYPIRDNEVDGRVRRVEMFSSIMLRFGVPYIAFGVCENNPKS